MTKEIALFAEPMLAGAAALLLSPALAFGAAQNDEGNADTSALRNGTSQDSMVQAVESELRNAQGLDGETISVGTEDGILALSGEVGNILAHDRAMRIAASVKNVQALEDNLTVRPTSVSDAVIETDVASALAFDPATEFWQINAEVQGGKVMLSGSVESYAEKSLAAKVAKGVRGVRSVENDIQVVYEVDRTDRQIAHDVTQVLKWSTIVDSGGIAIDVEDGIVTLSGTVDSLYEKHAAARLAQVAGVEEIKVADLQVQWSDEDIDQAAAKRLSDTDIGEAVQTALVLNPRVSSFEPTIEVEVADGVVTLNGTVDNLKAKGAAAQAARNTLGVTDVLNQLTVEPEQAIADRLGAGARR